MSIFWSHSMHACSYFPSTHAFEIGLTSYSNVNSIEKSGSFVDIIMVWMWVKCRWCPTISWGRDVVAPLGGLSLRWEIQWILYIYLGRRVLMMRNSLSILSPRMGATPLCLANFSWMGKPGQCRRDYARYCYFVFGVALWPLSNLRLVVCWWVACLSTFPHLAAMTSGPFNFLWTHIPKSGWSVTCEVDKIKDRPCNG